MAHTSSTSNRISMMLVAMGQESLPRVLCSILYNARHGLLLSLRGDRRRFCRKGVKGVLCNRLLGERGNHRVFFCLGSERNGVCAARCGISLCGGRDQ